MHDKSQRYMGRGSSLKTKELFNIPYSVLNFWLCMCVWGGGHMGGGMWGV